MLLPSAMPCDLSQGMVSPPASPPTLSSPASFSIASSCLSLQNLIAGSNASAPNQQLAQQGAQQTHLQDAADIFGGALPKPLPTPPMAHAPSPMKLRLRGRGAQEEARGIVKRTTAPRHKRNLSASQNTASSEASDREDTPEPPTTPKRSRIAPERMPLGLERADFHNLHAATGDDAESAADSASGEWTAEDDRMLVELVLEKLKLSKSDWQDCARNLGKDRHSLSRRWKSLMLNDEVGLKRRKIHSTWR